MSAASSDSRHMMSSVSITAASLHHQRAAPLLVEVVEELVASRREPRDVDRDRLTGRHHALAVQLEALELDRRRGLVRDLEAQARERSAPGLTAANRRPAPASPASDAVHAGLGTGRAPPALAALGADAIELHAVAPHHEAEEATDAVLEALQLLARELDDLAAALADDVVVVLALPLDRLEARLAVVEVALGSEPDLFEQLERAVDGGVADAGVHLLDRRVELLDGEVPRGAEEHARDVVPLGGRFETPLAQRPLEPPHPRAYRHGSDGDPAARARRPRSRRAAGVK